MTPDRGYSPYSQDFYREIEKELETMKEKTLEEQHKAVVEEMKSRGIIE